MDRIDLDNVNVDCVVGTRSDERHRTQTVSVNLTALLDVRKAAASCRLHDTFDYSVLYAATQFIVTEAHFLLLETAAEALARYMLISSAGLVHSATVSISKPDIMPTPTLPRITLTRTIDSFLPINRRTAFGTVTTMQESSNAGIYLITFAAQHDFASHGLEHSTEHTLTISTGLTLQGKSVPHCYAVAWPPNTPRHWHNPTPQPQHLLCINRPACDPATATPYQLTTTKLQAVAGKELYPY